MPGGIDDYVRGFHPNPEPGTEYGVARSYRSGQFSHPVVILFVPT